MGNDYSVSDINKRVKDGRDHRRRFECAWARSIKKYGGGLLSDRRDWQSTLSVPIANMMVEQMVADEMDMVFSKGVPIEVVPSPKNWNGDVLESEFIEAADRINRLVGDEINSVSELNRKWENGIRWCYLVGTGIWKVYRQEDKNTFDDVNPYTFIVEPGATSIKNARWVAQELVMDKDWVRGMFDTRIFTEIEGFGSGGFDVMLKEESAKEPYSKEKKNEFGADSSVENTVQYKDKVNVIEYWENNRLVVILNEKYKVRDEENPYAYTSPSGQVMQYKPFISKVCNNTADEFWGGGFLENYVSLLDSYDMSVNMQIDCAKLAMNPMRYIGRTSGISGNIKTEPGKGIPVRALGEVQDISFDNARVASMQIESSLKRYVESTSGQTAAWGGRTDPANNDTAMGAAIMTDRAGKRMQFYIKKGVDMLKEFGEQWLCLDRKFIDKPVNVMRKQWQRNQGSGEFPFMSSTASQKMSVTTVTPYDLMFDMDVMVRPIWMAQNKVLWQQTMTQAMSILKGTPEIDATVLYKNYIKAIDFPEPDGLLLEGEEIVQHAIDQAKITKMIEMTVAPIMTAGNQPAEQAGNINAQTNVPAPAGVPGENQYTGA